jgi:hypothetical protein
MIETLPHGYELAPNDCRRELVHIRKLVEGKWLFIRKNGMPVGLTSQDQATRYAIEHHRLGLPYDQAVPEEEHF